jgi:hypothetical protein
MRYLLQSAVVGKGPTKSRPHFSNGPVGKIGLNAVCGKMRLA